MILETLVKPMMLVHRKFGFESKEAIKVRQIIDNFISDSTKYINKINQEYIEFLRKRSLK